MHAKAARGEIAESVVKEFDQATDFKKLPERKGSFQHHPDAKRLNRKKQ